MTKKELSLKLFNYFESHSNDRYELTDFYDYIDALEYDETTDTYSVNKDTALNWYVKDISDFGMYGSSATVDTLTYELDMMDDEDTDERNEIEQLLNDIKKVED